MHAKAEVKHRRAIPSKMPLGAALVLEFLVSVFGVILVSQQQIHEYRILRTTFIFLIKLLQALARKQRGG